MSALSIVWLAFVRKRSRNPVCPAAPAGNVVDLEAHDVAFDLRAGDVVIDVAPMDRPDRNWSVMALDAYTYVSYASRRLHRVDGVSARLTLEPAVEWSRTSSTTIPVGTPTVWVLTRVMVDGPDDLDTARTIQRAITVQHPRGTAGTPTEPLGPPNAVHSAGARYFDELRTACAVDPPAAWHPPPSTEAAAVLTGQNDLPPDVLVEAVSRGERDLRRSGFAHDVRANGWGTRLGGSDFGPDVMVRAAAAKFALAGHHPAENRTYVALTDLAGAPLDGDRPLTLRFPPGGTPPCAGFWSLTVYGTDMFLVANEIDRYSIGDRTPGLRRADDGTLTLVIGGAHPSDPSNWLPAPPGRYHIALRVYEGEPSVVDATWFPPPLVPAPDLPVDR